MGVKNGLVGFELGCNLLFDRPVLSDTSLWCVLPKWLQINGSQGGWPGGRTGRKEKLKIRTLWT